jgi:drug/metabolite transporter (DMT)-like permease
MNPSFFGIPLGLAAAALWAVSPMFMASAGRRIGSSFPVTLLRMVVAVAMLAVIVPVYALATPGAIAMPNPAQVAWIVLAGLAGMMVGDLLIYEAYVTLGTCRTIQMLTIAPAFSALMAWAFLGEALTGRMVAGITLVIAGTSYAILKGARPGGDGGTPSREPGVVSRLGLVCGLSGALFMAIGAVLTRQAFNAGRSFDPVVATAIRVCAGFVGLWTIPVVRGRTAATLAHLRDAAVLRRITAGTAIGPVLGMLCYVSALKFTNTGLVSTVVATSPLFALPITRWRYGTRIGWDTVLAAAVAVAGVGMISWTR